jgi:hypothetical protein
MDQLLLLLSDMVKVKLPICIASIQRPKQGMQWLVWTELLFMGFNRAKIVHWVCENKRPFSIVKDRGFQSLMKTGRPDYHIPSPSTVSRDVKLVFANSRKRIAKILQVC